MLKVLLDAVMLFKSQRQYRKVISHWEVQLFVLVVGILTMDMQRPYPTNDYLAVLINYRTTFFIFLLRKKSYLALIINDLEKMFHLFGYSRKIISEYDPQLTSTEFRSYTRQVKSKNATQKYNTVVTVG